MTVLPAPTEREHTDMARDRNHDDFGSEHALDSAVSIHDVTVAYHRRPVLWDVDLDIPRGILAAVIGPNGAGKSTLVKACLDLVPRLYICA